MNAPSSLNSQLADCSFTQLVEFYRLLSQKGETLDVAALIKLAPHLETEIKEQFPLVTLLDDAMGGDIGNDRTAPSTLPASVAGCVLQEEIGRGGMGVVYRGHQPELDRDVAVKIIQLNGDLNSHLDRFEIERHALARLDHPNVIPAYSFTQDSKYAYLVMKLISGNGLNRLMANDGDYKARVQLTELRTDWTVFASMAAAVASGLQHAHENGLIHRDIKPANLLLDKDGKIWISDFGLAKMSDFAHAISRTGDVVGTPKYMAPEQLHGVCDPRSDIYSLGITLYELAAGQSARGKDWKPNQILEDSLPRVQDIRELNPEIPADLAHVIMKACRYLPEDRYQSAEEFEVVLRRFLDGRVADRRKKKRKPDAIFRKEFRRKATISIAGTMLVCAALTYFVMRPPVSRQVIHNTNILELLSDGNDPDRERKLAMALRDEVVRAAEQSQLPEKEKVEVVTEVSVLFEQLKDGQLSGQRMGKILDNYKDSNLAMATKIWSTNAFVQNSAMTSTEKLKATKILHRFAFLTAKKRLTTADITRLNNSLTGGKSATEAELHRMQFSTQQLRNWIARIDRGTKNLVQPNEEIDLSREIRNLFVAPETAAIVKQTKKTNGDLVKDLLSQGQVSIPANAAAEINRIKSRLSAQQVKQLKAKLNGLR